MSLTLIPKTDDERGGLGIKPSPAWFYAEGLNDEQVVWIRCACGQLTGVGNHTIHSDGLITPSLHHDVQDCGWHVWGKLENYP